MSAHHEERARRDLLRARISALSALTVGLVALASAASGAACTVGGPSYETVTIPVRSQDTALVCGSPFIAPDLTTLVACGNGAGHCYPGDKVSMTELPACDNPGDVCVPDPVLKSNGQPLKACTFFIGNKPGACVSTLIKDIGLHQDQLQQDVCADGERCGPCISPEDGTVTHLCDPMGVHGDACEAGAGSATPTPCCHYAGVCMDKDGIPEGSQGDMHPDSCTDGKLCAPADLTNGTPVKCNVLGLDGVCLDLCFATMLKGTSVALRAGCGPTEVCLPCVVGKGEGMPGCD